MSSKQGIWAAGAGNVLVYVLGLVMSLAVVRWLLPERLGRVGNFKMEQLGEMAADCDTIFLGSSRIHGGIDPHLFDEQMALAGYESRSYNFGMGGCLTPDLCVLIERLADLELPKLRRIFVAPEGRWAASNARNSRSQVNIAVHDPMMTMRYCALVMRTDLPLGSQIKLVCSHLESGAFNLFNVGLGQTFLDPLLGRGPDANEEFEWGGDTGDGFRALGQPGFSPQNRLHRLHLKDTKSYLKKVAAFTAREREGGVLDSFDAFILTELAEGVKDLAAETIFILPPGLNPYTELILAERAGILPVVMEYNDPEAYPELFEHDSRWEINHLNVKGSRKLTRLIVRDYCNWLEEGRSGK